MQAQSAEGVASCAVHMRLCAWGEGLLEVAYCLVHEGEDLIEAVKREVLEESGVR
jgi:hypothetical protein